MIPLLIAAAREAKIPASIKSGTSRTGGAAPRGGWFYIGVGVVATLHLAALAVVLATNRLLIDAGFVKNLYGDLVGR